jgi:hypothetical protein
MARVNPKTDPEFRIKHLAANIAMDARINAYIVRFANIKDSTLTFKNLYTKELVASNALMALLCPGYSKEVPTDEMRSVYDYLYATNSTDIYGFKDLYEMVLDYLRQNLPPQDQVFLFIGDHDPNTIGEKIAESNLPEGLKDAITKYIKEHQKDGTKTAGRGKGVQEQILDDALGIESVLNIEYFKRLSFNSIMNNVRLTMLETSTQKTKDLFMPARISNADIFKMMMGHIPISWDVFQQQPVKSKMKVPIYLDVSGSMWSELPVLIKMILNIRDDIDYVWGFSNFVHKHTMEDLKNKKIKSSGGTDFDCILEHAKENNFRSILVITDGYAYCKEPAGKKLDYINDAVVVLCTSARSKDNYLCQTYSTVQIEEVTI